jgi:periplasmic divalent cation tolerance protein
MEDSDQSAVPSSAEIRNAEDRAASRLEASQVTLIYTTFPSKSEAKKAGRALIESGMAACVNIFPKMTSIYIWEGEVQKSREAAMLVKTASHRSAEVLAEIKRLHPYSLPARLALAVEGGGADFLEWITRETGGKAAS